MNLNTKANNMFRIIGRYIHTDIFEVIDSATCYDSACKLLYEYRLSFGSKYELKILEE
jgi:hypothetical protein